MLSIPTDRCSTEYYKQYINPYEFYNFPALHGTTAAHGWLLCEDCKAARRHDVVVGGGVLRRYDDEPDVYEITGCGGVISRGHLLLYKKNIRRRTKWLASSCMRSVIHYYTKSNIHSVPLYVLICVMRASLIISPSSCVCISAEKTE